MSEFANILRNFRKSSKISQGRLGKGICSASEISRVESGQREAGFLLQSALLARLGFSSGGYDSYIYRDEYDRYRARKRIIEMIEMERFEEAAALIEDYRCCCVKAFPSSHAPSLSIELQFCEAMYIQLLRGQNESEEIILHHCTSAMRLSMGHIMDSSSIIKDCLFSFQEIDILLEYRHSLAMCSVETTDFSYGYKEIYEWIIEQSIDYTVNAIIISKIAIYYARFLKKKGLIENNAELLANIEIEAIKALRRSQKCVFLYELNCQIQELKDICGGVFQDCLDLDLVNTTSENLRQLYREYGGIYEKRNDMTLYYEKRVFFVGNVISRRRKTFQYTNETLCEGICDKRVLQGLVSGRTQTQSTIIKALFSRMKLHPDFTDFEIDSADRNILKARWNVSLMLNNGQYAECKAIIAYLKDNISMKSVENSQAIMYLEDTLAHKEAKVTDEEYVTRLRHILELSFPIETIAKSKDIFLSSWELNCINKLLRFSSSYNETLLRILQKVTDTIEKNADEKTNFELYTFAMESIYRKLVKAGKYDDANALALRLLKLSFDANDVGEIYHFTYDILRVEGVSNSSHEYIKKRKQFLKNVLALCDYCKDIAGRAFFSNLDESPIS